MGLEKNFKSSKQSIDISRQISMKAKSRLKCFPRIYVLGIISPAVKSFKKLTYGKNVYDSLTIAFSSMTVTSFLKAVLVSLEKEGR